jgi:hypothetical protein
LIVLDDGLQSVAVRLVSPTPREGYYDAEVVIRSDFVNATVRTGFDVEDISEWDSLLDAVEEADAKLVRTRRGSRVTGRARAARPTSLSSPKIRT